MTPDGWDARIEKEGEIAMAYFRVNKNRDYTVMSNHHLRDKNLSLKAVGLLSKMLSLPDDWDYSVKGLVAICKDKESAVKSALTELKNQGYVVVTKLMPGVTDSGRIEYIYDIYESPQKQGAKKQGVEKQGVEFLDLEILATENQPQLNTNRLNTKELNTERASTQEKAVEPNVVNIEDQQKQTTDCDGFAKVIDFYKTNFGLLNSYMADELRQTYDEWDSSSEEPALIIVKAMQIALEKNARNWKFVLGVLRQWEGKARTLADAETLEVEHKNRQCRQRETRIVGADVKRNSEELDRLAKEQNAGIDMDAELAKIKRLKYEMGMQV